MAFRFAHASDIHLLDLRGVWPWRYFNKRITGRLNLALRRGRKHDGAVFDAMVIACAELGVDRLVLTGDLTNLSLESEFAFVCGKLDDAPMPATVIPGNHDAYTRGAARDGLFERFLGGHMQGERQGEADYPFVQRFDGIALIGLSTAVPTLPLHASGRVGAQQCARLGHVLRQTADEGRVRVVLIHHPPVAGVSKKRHDLLDLDAFGAVIAEHGADLVLHGHEHRRLQTTLQGPDGPVPVHGISSGTAVSQSAGHEAAFSVYAVDEGEIQRELYLWDGARFRNAPPEAAAATPQP